jgi:AraC family transcriptional regulator
MKSRSCLITEAWFPPGTVLDDHRHDGTIVAVMLEGSFTTTLGRRRLDCSPSTAWTEPAEERHANHVGRHGAHVIVAQLDHSCTELFDLFRDFMSSAAILRDPVVVADARRLARELAIADSLSPVAAESLVLTMMTAAARAGTMATAEKAAPPWIARAREVIHAEFRQGLRLETIAAEANVHPSHLAHEFRRRFRCTVGEYARKLRLSWAVDRLQSSDEPISQVALSAGYCDQAHLTRECTRELGLTPARLRARNRKGSEAN